MSPSRGPNTSKPNPGAKPEQEPTSTEIANTADASSSSALTSLKQNISYLITPASASASQPARFRTRALLRSLHYLGVFVFWRVVRYAKYAVVGSIVAAVSATAFGGFVSGVGWVLAPPTLVGSVGIGLLWWVGRWGFRKLGVGRRVVDMGQREMSDSRRQTTVDGQWRDVQGPRAVPW